MGRVVQCVKLKREAEGMKWKPFQDEFGQKLYDNVSEEAWRAWIEHSKMIINEYRLDLMSPRAKAILREQCNAYFFGDGGAAPPPEYVAPKSERGE
jgi:Fe-S cluster biosynthesis and repair protein YggX